MSSTTRKHDYNKLKFYTKDKLNLLITGLSTACINFSIFGMLSCGNIDLFKVFPQAKEINIKNIMMSPDLKQTFVAAYVDSTVHILTYDNDMFCKYTISLHNLAIQHGLVHNTVSYINDTIQSITEAWESVLLEMDNKLIKFADSQPAGKILNNVKKIISRFFFILGTLSPDFLELLMFGYPPTTAMHQFLTK